ncbi:MAG: methyl-accepting chemotaxis protein [Lachnospiraceae bacterium]|nr:methyl-accepting chemotaxis protein [Lachnospiraceae bacterium]
MNIKNYIKRKKLTPEQYKMANKTMYIILAVCYILYSLIELMNVGEGTHGFYRIGFYMIFAIASGIVVKKKGEKKFAMLFMAITFLITYLLLVMNNGVTSMVMAFPALIGFMLYMNSLLITSGCISVYVVGSIKCFIAWKMGDITSFQHGSLILTGFFICIYGSYMAIKILYEFSEQDREIIVKESAHRKEMASVVAETVEKIAEEFHEVLIGFDEINEAMSSADDAMNNIAGSSESTADAVSRQAAMTSDIQTRIENTNELVINARGTTEKLKNVVGDGKQLADNLQEQSNLVDQNITRISETVEELVTNVQKVSGITDSILNISSQTNLLALNASIEAARAGEAGKGFAVVADQIRKLAEETKVSTEKITEIINQLTNVTNETQAGIEESAEAINIQRKKVEEVNESFTEVENGMITMQRDVATMSQEVEKVLEANREIVDSISLLSAASEEVSAGTQTCKATINGASEKVGRYADKVEGTFEQLQILVEKAEME